MIRALLNFGIALVMAALGILIASWIVEGVTVTASGFVVAVLVYAVAQALLSPFVFKMATKYASAILGGIGLVSTFLALWIATIVSGGLSISGVASWIAAPVVVWVVTALGSWFLGWLVIRRWWDRRQQAAKIRSVTAKG